MSPKENRPPVRKRKFARILKRALGVLLLLGVIALIVLAAIPRPVPADVATAESGEMSVSVDEDGRARVKDRHVVSAPLSGSLARIELDPGDRVEQGQIVARIVPLDPPLLDARTKSQAESRIAASLAAERQARAQTERAKAALEFSRKNTERVRELVQRNVVPRQELEQSELEVRTRSADLDSARFGARVADYEVKMARAALGHLSAKGAKKEEQMELPAPVTGRILRVIQESEGVVQTGTPLLEIGDPQALEIVVDVLTSDAVEIRPGGRATIDRWGGEPLLARVRLVEPSAFTRLSALGVEEQRVNVVLDLESPRDKWRALGDGYRVEAKIRVWEAQDVIKVPASAVFRHQGAWALYRIEGGAARLTPVSIGKRNPREVQVLEGIAAGDSVVVHPSDRVEDGVKIEAR
jgi:HlyD family secretion protein